MHNIIAYKIYWNGIHLLYPIVCNHIVPNDFSLIKYNFKSFIQLRNNHFKSVFVFELK